MNRMVFLGCGVVFFVDNNLFAHKDSTRRRTIEPKDLIGRRIRYPYYGGGDRPMVFAVHRVLEAKERWLRVDRQGDRQPWVYFNKDVTLAPE